MMTRRSFLSSASTVALGAALAPQGSLGQADVTVRLPLALSQYSLRAMLKDGSLDALDFPSFTADTFGIHAIDLWEGGLPGEKLDDRVYLETMRANAEAAGTDLFLLMSGVLKVATDHLEGTTAAVLKSIDRAEILGCDFVRVFLGAPGTDVDAAIAPCVEALKVLSDAAAEKGLIIAIEPGASELSKRGAFLAQVGEALHHPGCCLMPDFGKLVDNIYDGTEVMLPQSKTISCKMHSFDEAGKQPDFDYLRLMKMIVDSDYEGYLAIEWEGQTLAAVPGVLASKKLILDSLAGV